MHRHSLRNYHIHRICVVWCVKVCWFSTGISSFVACYLSSDVDEIIYTHVSNQHPDSLRFLHDCEKILGRKITILCSEEYESVDDVIIRTRCINTPFGAPCTKKLKREVRKQWERQHPDHHIYVWGYDKDEMSRADRIIKSMSDYDHEFPLIDNNISKSDAHGIAERLGLKRPAMYDLGYSNNNCIGCVKGGMGYWNKIRKDFPEVFQRRALQEREIGHSCIKGVFLDELKPDAGNLNQEVMEECGIFCELALRQQEKLSYSVLPNSCPTTKKD